MSCCKVLYGWVGGWVGGWVYVLFPTHGCFKGGGRRGRRHVGWVGGWVKGRVGWC